ncbi:MAG: signal peptidase II [candidate division Zixibacteria bacterium]|nr:signal peptidase II [candidate division Zixibacteria bacterium]
MTKNPLVKLIIIFVIVVVADQWTKYLALANLQLGLPVDVVGSYLRWTLAYNPGGAFGMRLGSSNAYLIISIIIFIVLCVYIYQNRRVGFIAIPLTFVSGGAVGNIIDRVRFGEVVDFIDCEFPDISLAGYEMQRWPIFNVADMAVSCGIITTILLILYQSRKEARQDAQIAGESDDTEVTSDAPKVSRD